MKKIWLLPILFASIFVSASPVPFDAMAGGLTAKTVVAVTVSPHGAVVRQGSSVNYATNTACLYSDSTTDNCVSANAGTGSYTSYTPTCYPITSSGVATWQTGSGCNPENNSVYPSGAFTAQGNVQVCFQGVCDSGKMLAQSTSDTFYPYMTPDYRSFNMGDNFANRAYDLTVAIGAHVQIGLGYVYNNADIGTTGTPGQFTCNYDTTNHAVATVDRYGTVTTISAGNVTVNCNPFISGAVLGTSVESGWTSANGGNGINFVVTNITTTQTQWFVRKAGGATYYDPVTSPTGACDGLTNVDAAGATGHHCAVASLRTLAWDGINNNDPSNNVWKFKGGDIVTLQANTAALGYPMGSNNAGPTQCFFADPSCYLPPFPSGTLAHPTIIQGENVGNCAADSQKSFLLGTGGQKYIYNLHGSQNVVTKCVFITQSDSCGGGGSAFVHQCGGGDYGFAQNGIWISALDDGIVFEDVVVEGTTQFGMFGASGYNGINMNRFRISYSPGGGINMDDAAWSTSNISVSGGLTMANAIIEWSGCSSYKGTSAVYKALECWDSNGNGNWNSPDGIGEGNTSGHWSFDHVIMRYNWQDDFDMLHAGMQYISITNSLSYNSIGASFKMGPSDASYLINNRAVVACERMKTVVGDQNPTSIPSPTASPGVQYCRGNDWLGFNFAANGVYHFFNNSLTGYQQNGLDYGCTFGYETCVADAEWVNNVFVGYSNPNYNSGTLPGATNWGTGSFPYFTTNVNSVWSNIRNCPLLGTNVTCNTVNPTFTSQPASPMASDSSLDNYNFFPTGASPLLGAGTPLSAVTTDAIGTARPNPPAIGALQLLGTPTAAQPTSTLPSGAYAGPQTPVLACSDGGCSICYTLDGSTPTTPGTPDGTCTHGTRITGGSGTVSVTVTLALKALSTLAGYVNSTLATFNFTINPAPPAGLSIGAGQSMGAGTPLR